VDHGDRGLYRPDWKLWSREFLNPRNRPLLDVSVPSFLCPSDALHRAGTNYRVNLGCAPGRPLPGVFAVSEWKSLAPQQGAFGPQVRLSDFRDGISNTALLSERVMGDGLKSYYDPWRDVADTEDIQNLTPETTRLNCQRIPRGDSPHSSFWGHTWLFPGYKTTAYNHVLPPNSRIPDCAQLPDFCVDGGDGATSARSFHPGGVNVAMGDVSVRFVNDQIDPLVWRAMSTRQGGESFE
jgi:hypothetical protein